MLYRQLILWTLRFLTVVLGVCGIFQLAIAAQLTLSWNDNSSNEDGFRIERRIGTSGTHQQLANRRIEHHDLHRSQLSRQYDLLLPSSRVQLSR